MSPWWLCGDEGTASMVATPGVLLARRRIAVAASQCKRAAPRRPELGARRFRGDGDVVHLPPGHGVGLNGSSGLCCGALAAVWRKGEGEAWRRAWLL